MASRSGYSAAGAEARSQTREIVANQEEAKRQQEKDLLQAKLIAEENLQAQRIAAQSVGEDRADRRAAIAAANTEKLEDKRIGATKEENITRRMFDKETNAANLAARGNEFNQRLGFEKSEADERRNLALFNATREDQRLAQDRQLRTSIAQASAAEKAEDNARAERQFAITQGLKLADNESTFASSNRTPEEKDEETQRSIRRVQSYMTTP